MVDHQERCTFEAPVFLGCKCVRTQETEDGKDGIIGQQQQKKKKPTTKTKKKKKEQYDVLPVHSLFRSTLDGLHEALVSAPVGKLARSGSLHVCVPAATSHPRS